MPEADGHAGDLLRRHLLARLRNHTFFSLAELNAEILRLLATLNAKVLRKMGRSRRELFETIDRPALRPLAADGYEFAEWSKVRVHIDCSAGSGQLNPATAARRRYSLTVEAEICRLRAIWRCPSAVSARRSASTVTVSER